MSAENEVLSDILFSVENEDLPHILLSVQNEYLSDIRHTVNHEGILDVQHDQHNFENEEVRDISVNFENGDIHNIPHNIENEDLPEMPHAIENGNLDDFARDTGDENLADVSYDVEDEDLADVSHEVEDEQDLDNIPHNAENEENQEFVEILHNVEDNVHHEAPPNIPHNFMNGNLADYPQNEDEDFADEPLEISIEEAPINARKRRRRELRAQREADFPSPSSDEAPPRKVRRRLPRRREPYEEVQNEVPVVQVNRRMMNRRLFDRVCEDFVETVVPRLSDSQFKTIFRVSRKTWRQLQECFFISAEAQNLVPMDKRSIVPMQDYILMFLWFIGTGRTVDGLSETFDVARDDAIFVLDVCLNFFTLYSPNLLPFPKTRRHANRYAEVFSEVFDFPNTIGCVTMRHFLVRNSTPIRPPVWTTVQTITDARGRFLHVHMDSMKMHPRDILDQSQIGETLSEFCSGKFHLIGDENHFVRHWLLTPFEHAEATNEILFNERHKAVMDSGHRAWNMVVDRFAQLRSQYLSAEYAHGIVRACCMVQNVCTDERDYYNYYEPTRLNQPMETLRPVNVIHDDPDLRSLGLLKRRQASHDMI